MKKQKFNSKAFAKAILAKRVKDDLSFKKIEASVKGAFTSSALQKLEAETITPSITLFVEVCNWLNVPAQSFLN